MQDQRNPMKIEEVTADTPFEIDHTFRHNGFGRIKGAHRPTVAYVVAIKPCGCTGPTLGSVETVPLPPIKNGTYMPPKSFDASEHGYELRVETKDRVGLYRNGDRIYGKRWFGDERHLAYMARTTAWRHYRHTVMEAQRPRYPDAAMYHTKEEAMDHRPLAQCKLWGILPDRPYRYDRKPKPVGYVWGKDAAAKALHRYWVDKNKELSVGRAMAGAIRRQAA